MGLPKVLETVITSLLDASVIRSWTIYHEKDDSVNLKIRFAPTESVKHAKQATRSHFRKVSERQAMRDRQRSQQWRETVAQKQTEFTGIDSTVTPQHKDCVRSDSTDTQRELTNMSTNVSYDRITTRSMSKEVHLDTETFRASTSHSPVIDLIVDTTPLNPHAHPYQPSTPDTMVNYCSPLAQDQPFEQSVHEEMCSSPSVVTGCSDVDSSSDSDDSTGIVDCDCHNNLCAYGSYPRVRNNDRVFLCTRCPQNDKMYVCSTCRSVGGHQRHATYLKQLTLDT